MKTIQLSLNLEYGITKEQACILCHLSSGCPRCCLRCNGENSCNGQLCSQPARDYEGQRWDTWMHLLRHYDNSELVKVIPANLRKKYNIKTIKTKAK